MKRILFSAAAAAALTTGSMALAQEGEYTTIEMAIDIDKSAEEVWAEVGGWCDIGTWANLDCEVTSGDSEMGSVRKLAGGRVTEIMVAKTDLSYGYTQPAVEGRFYNLYHGFMEARPVDEDSSRMLYTLVYDTSNMNEEEKEADVARRRGMFEGLLQDIKEMVEAE